MCPRVDLQLGFSGEGRDIDFGSESGFRKTDEDVEEYIVTLTTKNLVPQFFDDNDKISRRSAPWSGIAFSPEWNVVAVCRSGRNGYADRCFTLEPTIAFAAQARCFDDLSFAAAILAGGDVDHLTEDRSRNLSDLAGAFAEWASLHRPGFTCASSSAGGADDQLFDFQTLVRSSGDLFERQRKSDLQVRSLNRT